MVLYSVISPYEIFPFTAPENSVKSIDGGYVEYRNINGECTAVSLRSTNPYDYISSKYFNPKINSKNQKYVTVLDKQK